MKVEMVCTGTRTRKVLLARSITFTGKISRVVRVVCGIFLLTVSFPSPFLLFAAASDNHHRSPAGILVEI